MAQGRAVPANGGECRPGIGLEQAGDEGIRMLCRKRVRHKMVGRKILEIAGHDHIRAAVYGCRQGPAGRVR